MRAIVAGVLALAVLGGCATPREPVGTGTGLDWDQRRELLRNLEDWRLEGRLALRSGEEGYNGSLNWEQMRDDMDLRVSGPFGVGGFRIYGSIDRLRLETSRGDSYLLQDPESEMVREFGWSLPVGSMRFWVLGVSDPALAAQETVDDQGRLVTLQQAGWAIRYDRYTMSEGTLLPAKMVMENGNVRIRLVTDRWTLSLPDPDLI